jgi:isocitrate dehydrogenase kinase/phosphatase
MQGGIPADLASQSTAAILAGFSEYQDEFKATTSRAGERFSQRDWRGLQADARARLDLYNRVVRQVVERTRKILGSHDQDKQVWARMKSSYSSAIQERGDSELAETFFNSITRRIFTTVGVDPEIEFVDAGFDTHPSPPPEPVYLTFYRTGSLADLLAEVFQSFAFEAPFADLERDLNLAAAEIASFLDRIGEPYPLRVIEFLQPVFYRSKGAYLVGRARLGNRFLPLVFSLRHPPEGIGVDAVLLNEADVSILFSFTRSHFLTQVDPPYPAVAFLKSIMPQKPVAELYTALGYNKHGKTELYRDLLHHLEKSRDKFILAPGEKGMVMLVFTLPSYDLVFKVIRDRFDEPKTSTRQDVMDRYNLVFTHDRAGRLVDAQEFEHLRFERSRFSKELLDELLREAPGSLTLDGDDLSIRHLYTERRVIPLNIYLKEVPQAAAVEAALDYGQAIKDLAATNIFPGDILLKNFGVTRHGRVVFYDYDELSLLTALRFRSIPPPRSSGDEFAAEPWFFVDEKDIFPEELKTFLGLRDGLREPFLDSHADLFTPGYWREVQKRLKAGELVEIAPYGPEKRLANRKQPG